MRKIIKPAVKCKACGQITEGSVEQSFCDNCGKQLPKKMYPLDFTIFEKAGEKTGRFEVDTWKCAREYFIKNKARIGRSWFVSLPSPEFRGNSERKQYCDSGENFFKDFLCVVPKPTEDKK